MRLIILALILSGCSGLRTVGNNETHILEPGICGDIGVIERDGACYSRVIISAKNDGHVVVKKPDGTTYEVNNTGNPSFAHDLATAVQAIAIQKAVLND